MDSLDFIRDVWVKMLKLVCDAELLSNLTPFYTNRPEQKNQAQTGAVPAFLMQCPPAQAQ